MVCNRKHFEDVPEENPPHGFQPHGVNVALKLNPLAFLAVFQT